MKETDPDFDLCAICVEGYKAGDVLRVLPCKYVLADTVILFADFLLVLSVVQNINIR